ncbi:MAG: hypothetical protein HYY42_02295 [Chloroflexi bacterium]|nr:hypothetical protein [Chloroflexota bacterium]
MNIQHVGALSAATAAIALVLVLSLRGEAPDVALPHPDASALRDAGWDRGLRRWEALRAGIVLSVLTAAFALGIPVGLVLLAAVAPSIWIRLRAETARDGARRAFGRVLAGTESALRSGLSLPDALRRGSDVAADGLASRPLVDALRAFDLGAGLDSSLLEAARSCRDERARVAIMSLAIGIAERLPRERLADLMAAIADRVAFEERLEDEVRAKAAGVRQQQRLLALLVPALATYLAVTMPTLAVTLGSDLGRFVLIPGAVALEAAGVILGRRVVRGALR